MNDLKAAAHTHHTVEFLHPHTMSVDIAGNFHRGLMWGIGVGFVLALAVIAVSVQILLILLR